MPRQQNRCDTRTAEVENLISTRFIPVRNLKRTRECKGRREYRRIALRALRQHNLAVKAEHRTCLCIAPQAVRPSLHGYLARPKQGKEEQASVGSAQSDHIAGQAPDQ